MTASIPNLKTGRVIEKISAADIRMCWTCSTCLAECPVNVGTNRLQPMKIVRMANWGLLEEMVRLPEIWFCLECRRCDTVCPMMVKPSSLIAYLRREALCQNLYSYASTCRIQEIRKRFYRSQWLLAKDYIQGFSKVASPAVYWHTAANMGFQTSPTGIRYRTPGKKDAFDVASCLTCGECCSACPVFCEAPVFSPMHIVRQYRFGLLDELIISPDIWLCLDCRRCEDACSQSLSPRDVIHSLQMQSVLELRVHPDFNIHFQDACKALYRQLVQEIESCLN